MRDHPSDFSHAILVTCTPGQPTASHCKETDFLSLLNLPNPAIALPNQKENRLFRSPRPSPSFDTTVTTTR